MSIDVEWKRWNDAHPEAKLSRSRYRKQLKSRFPQAETTYRSALSGLEPVLLVPDSHHPFHDERACQLVLQVGHALSPSTVVALGDQIDFFSISDHDKSPVRKQETSVRRELESGRVWRSDLESIGAKRNIWVMGNHEFRWERFLSRQAPELYDLPEFQLDRILGLENWDVVPYRRHTRIGKLYVTHDVGNAGARAHIQAGQKFQSNAVIGHTHRIGMHYFSSATGESFVAAMLGWLGSPVAGEEYMHEVNQNVDWHLGFGVGWMEPSGIVHLQAIPIIDYTCVVNGVLYHG